MIEEYKKIIEDNLNKYFDKILEDKTYLYAEKTIKSMKYTTCLFGKRLRGIMCLETARILSGSYLEAVPAAMALEMLHAQSLIHDDLPSMDNDDLRRGKPSNHKVFGEAIAILAGDALISLGAQIIIDKTPSCIDTNKKIKMLKEYLLAAGIFGIVAGQMADIEAEDASCEIRENPDFIEFIDNYKTGALFEASCAIGAIIGGGDESKIELFRKFAKNFGAAFQIADDILDVISNSKELGKTTGKDECENKLTYVKRFSLEGAKEKLTSQLDITCDILKSENIQSKVFDRIINDIKNRIFKQAEA